MFRFVRHAKVIKEASSELAAAVYFYEMQFGIAPPGFWSDPYIVGFLGGRVGGVAKRMTDAKMVGFQLESIILSVLDDLSVTVRQPISDRYIQMMIEGSADFKKGNLNATKIELIRSGSREFDDDPDVMQAKREYGGEISKYLFEKYFLDEVRQRLAG